MKQERLKYLLEKYLSGQRLTDEENAELIIWYQSFDIGEAAGTFLTQKQQNVLKEKLWLQIQNATDPKVVSLNRKQNYIRKVAGVAASIAVLIGLGIFGAGIYRNNINSQRNIATQQIEANDIQPGGNKAILTLADGSTVYLDSVDTGILATQQDVNVVKDEEGSIFYQRSDDGPHSKALSYNIIRTPAGGQYAVRLADGTKVWLNALSSLKYPTEFSGADRTVELTGEGYFEIAHDASKPFFVKTAEVTVKAIGTEFNIRSNPDEEDIQTTLVNGRVNVTAHGASELLAPEEQAIFSKSKRQLLKTANVNTEEVSAWKNGYFYFNNRQLEEILADLARWYSASVVYNTKVPDKYSLKISRNVPVSKLLSFIELSGGVHFKITGQNIIVER